MKFYNKKQSATKAIGSLFMIISVLNFLSCSKTNFTPDENSALANPVLFENTYKTSPSEIQYTQPNLAENKTTISFQIKNLAGELVQNILKSQVKLVENGQTITDFSLNKNSVTRRTTADILFAIDVTGSMAPTIESAKSRIINFINSTRAQGYHTRMCLSTFGDYTVKKCTRFYNNDPQDPATAAEVTELISEITKLKALVGALDPGGRDFDENPLRAVIDAAAAPWASDSQRFVILVTDAGFLYSPGNSGGVGLIAPIYTDVLAAIDQSNIKIFAATPDLPGYNSKFGADDSIVARSGGEWFKYANLVSGAITLNTILNRILSSIDTTFFVDYTLTSQSSLDPSKPLSQRNIQIQLLDTTIGSFQDISVSSNLPNGRTADPKRFVVADRPINPNKLLVYADGVLQRNNYIVLSNKKEIEFLAAQRPNAKIKFKYEYESVRDSISLSPIQVSVGADKIALLKFSINNIPVDSRYYQVIPIGLNLASIVLNDEIFGSDDPFKINATSEMLISIKTK